MAKISNIEGIGPTYAAKLDGVGIKTTEQLLAAGKTKKGRVALETKTGITGKLILEWVNRADLFRVKGVGEEYSDLLEASGVDTVPELAQRNAANLFTKMNEVNGEKNLVRRTPALSMVERWVAHAKELPRAIEY